MNENLAPVCVALDNLGAAIVAGWASDTTLQAQWGWTCPPLNRHDLAKIAYNISSQLKQVNIFETSPEVITQLAKVTTIIQNLQANTIIHFYTGNGGQSSAAYITAMSYIENVFNSTLGWHTVNDPKTMPAQTAKRLRSLQDEIDELIPDKEVLKNQITLIQDATSAAESLPTDMKGLREARLRVASLGKDAAELYGQIELHSKTAIELTVEIAAKKLEADGLVDKCEEAYRITTTKGLAAAFDLRAIKLNQSMWVWVVGLMASLVVGAWIGSIRFQSLNVALNASTHDWGIIIVHIILSMFSVAAPIWFAWLSTKQIGQRFRLSEDYAFKASVAKAYEGYRKEAVRLDMAFESRLFSSALERLEEAPLRLVENDTHGSPWHELFNSKGFSKLIDKYPDAKDELLKLPTDFIQKAKTAILSSSKESEQTTEK